MHEQAVMGALLAVVAFLVSFVLTRWALAPGSPLYVLDHPNRRSLHEEPTPRGGGIAIGCGIIGAGAAGLIWTDTFMPVWVVAGAGVIVSVAFADDRSHVNAGVRLMAHFLAGALLLVGELSLDAILLPGLRWELSPAVGAAVVILWVVWMVNLYNFMDGMDGFAAGMAVVGFGCFGVLGLLAGDLEFLAANLVIVGAVAGFLVWNFPPARIFMGDVGSSLLGFLAAVMGLWAERRGLFPLWVAVLVFSPFIVDASTTLVFRLARRERLWEAHRSHCYQRLVRLGWGHRRTVLWEYVLMLACGISAFVAVRLGSAAQWWLLLGWAVTYTILMGLVRRLEARRRRDQSSLGYSQ